MPTDDSKYKDKHPVSSFYLDFCEECGIPLIFALSILGICGAMVPSHLTVAALIPSIGDYLALWLSPLVGVVVMATVMERQRIRVLKSLPLDNCHVARAEWTLFVIVAPLLQTTALTVAKLSSAAIQNIEFTISWPVFVAVYFVMVHAVSYSIVLLNPLPKISFAVSAVAIVGLSVYFNVSMLTAPISFGAFFLAIIAGGVSYFLRAKIPVVMYPSIDSSSGTTSPYLYPPTPSVKVPNHYGQQLNRRRLMRSGRARALQFGKEMLESFVFCGIMFGLLGTYFKLFALGPSYLAVYATCTFRFALGREWSAWRTYKTMPTQASLRCIECWFACVGAGASSFLGGCPWLVWSLHETWHHQIGMLILVIGFSSLWMALVLSPDLNDFLELSLAPNTVSAKLRLILVIACLVLLLVLPVRFLAPLFLLASMCLIYVRLYRGRIL